MPADAKSGSMKSPPPGDEFMRDIDRIVLKSLKNAEYPIESEDKRLRNYNFDEIVHMVIFCLRYLFPEKNFPESLPFGMQNRYRLSTELAEALMILNYGSGAEVGYHIFMYNNKEIRNVLIFLSDQLPQNSSSSSLPGKDIDKRLLIKKKVKEELKKLFANKNQEYHPGMTTTPFLALPLETGIVLPAQRTDLQPIEWKKFVTADLPYIDEQLSDDRCFLPSIVSLNATGLNFPKRMKNSSISSSPLSDNFFKLYADNATKAHINRQNATQDKESQSHSPDAEKINTDLLETEKAAIEVEKKIHEIKPRVEKFKEELVEVKTSTEKLQRIVKAKESKQSTLEHSLSLLPNSEANKEKLKNLIKKTKEKIVFLESQTNDHRILLHQKLEKLQKIQVEKLKQENLLNERISQIRTDVYGIDEQTEQRKILLQQLESRPEPVERDDRSTLVERIFKFIDNVKRQEDEIYTNLNDMRIIQKNINQESEKADRCFFVASQLIKDHISSDSFSAKAYQLLLTVHKLIADIIHLDAERVNQEKEVSQFQYELLNHEETSVDDALQELQSDVNQLETEIADAKHKMKSRKKEQKRLMDRLKR